MAEGIRIRHKSLKSVMLVVRDVSRPILKPHSSYRFPVCGICGYPHEHKTYHLQLDSEGTLIVSQKVYDRIMALGDQAGFEKVNMVKDPPTQVLLIPKADQKVKAFNPDRREHVYGN